MLLWMPDRRRQRATRERAASAYRSPPLVRRWRLVLPLEAGMGATPQSMAKAASAEAVVVFVGGDSELAGDVGAGSVRGDQAGAGRGHEGIQ
jgi:hypothetical protein